MYGSAQSANDAVRKLQAEGFVAGDIDLITATTGQRAAGAGDPVLAAILAGRVLRSKATVYAQGVHRGHALVIVRAPFSWGVDAVEILDSFGPVASGVPADPPAGMGWDEATPFSCAFRLPLLLPASTGFLLRQVPLVTRTGRTLCSALGLGELASPGPALSRVLGMPLLSRRGTPLSSAFGLRLLA
jgi:hypothetical protein